VVHRSFWRDHLPEILIALANVFAVGLGMGVPFFAILLGFPVGWWLVRRFQRAAGPAGLDPATGLRQLLVWGAGLAGVTLLLALVIWSPQIPNALDSAFDTTSFGIPLILYTPHASMIGWLVLMIVVSPVLQWMAVLTGGALALVTKPRAKR
jgi:hypothetical protein